jgi:putative tricarboxylic transport membrane protein
MAKRDLISGVFFFLLGGFSILGSLKYPFWDRYGPGPGFFPLVLGIAFTLLCVLLLGKTVGVYFRLREDQSRQSESSAFVDKGRFAMVLCSFLCFYLLFEPLGFLLTVFIYLFGVLLFLGKRSFKVALSVSVLSSVFVYLAFVYALEVQLPLGVLREFVFHYLVR